MGAAQVVPFFIILGKELIDAINKGALTPDFLTEGTLLLFRRFKAAFDSKDTSKLADEISDQFHGNFCGRQSKAELVNFFADAFQGIMWLVYPNLSITIYHIILKDSGVFKAILEFHSHLSFLGLPVKSFASGRLVCEARPEGPHSIWRLTQIEHA